MRNQQAVNAGGWRRLRQRRRSLALRPSVARGESVNRLAGGNVRRSQSLKGDRIRSSPIALPEREGTTQSRMRSESALQLVQGRFCLRDISTRKLRHHDPPEGKVPPGQSCQFVVHSRAILSHRFVDPARLQEEVAEELLRAMTASGGET